MKKFMFICILLVFSNLMYGQVKKGNYIKEVHLQKFVGTWQATTKQDTFTIVFQKQKVHFKDVDTYVDLILGWHKHVRDGKVIQNSLNEVGSGIEKSTINGRTHGEKNKLRILFNDSKRHLLLNGSLKLVGNRYDKGILKLSFGERIIMQRDKPIKEGPKIPVPSTWKVTKIK